VLVGAAILLLFYVIIRVGRGATLSFSPKNVTTIDASPGRLPYYAARTLIRMFIALGLSTAFTLDLRIRRCSQPARREGTDRGPGHPAVGSVLGFLSVTVTGYIALFPGSFLGLEKSARGSLGRPSRTELSNPTYCAVTMPLEATAAAWEGAPRDGHPSVDCRRQST
jgi:NitT/TauT family transport system permease protein